MLLRKSLGLGAAAAALAGLTVAVVPPASALAAAGVFTLCSKGGYWSEVTFPNAPSTYLQRKGCRSYSRPGKTNEQINVIAYRKNAFHLIGSTIYNGSVGETITTIMTKNGPSFTAHIG